MNNFYEVIKKIKPHTWVSLVMVLIVLINYVLTATGNPIIDLGEEEITYLVNTVLNLVFIGYAMWKNNSVTQNALMADQILYYLRDGKISKEELEKFIEDHKSSDVPTENIKIEDKENNETVEK